MTKATRHSGVPLALPAEHVDAGELLVERAGPRQSRLDRRARRGQILAVKRVAGLQPESVSGPPAHTGDTALQNAIPQRRGVLGNAHELAAALPV